MTLCILLNKINSFEHLNSLYKQNWEAEDQKEWEKLQ